MDTVNACMDEDTQEYTASSIFVKSNDAENVGSNDKSITNSERNEDKNSDSELMNADVQEKQLDQEPSSSVDPDDLEMEEDDITSKLLSIQVLPRIPKRKPATNNSSLTSVGETPSYCSVLERVNSDHGSDGARYPNWSAAGWSRSNIDRPVKQWNRKGTKDRKVESKPVKQNLTEKLPDYESKHKIEVTHNKLNRATEHSAWSIHETDVSSCPSFSEIDHTAADETAALSVTGPLPTLPFEEQMRERARLRNLKKQGGCSVANNGSESTEAALNNGDGSKDCFNMTAASNFHSDKAKTKQPVLNQGQQGLELPGCVNSVSLLHGECVENHQSSQHHWSENGHHHSHKAKKPSHQTNRMYAKDKTNKLHLTGAQDMYAVESKLKSKQESASPPLPYLPVLPLFATSETQTSDSTSHHVKQKSPSLRKKLANMSSSVQNTSARSYARDISSSVVSKLKTEKSSSAAAGTKSVTFSCDIASQDDNKIKRKSKPKVGCKLLDLLVLAILF